MVGMLQPGAILICWPDLIVSGDSVFILGQTWLVAMVPMEYTSQVLFPRLKIFSLVVAILNLQLFLMRVELPK